MRGSTVFVHGLFWGKLIKGKVVHQFLLLADPSFRGEGFNRSARRWRRVFEQFHRRIHHFGDADGSCRVSARAFVFGDFAEASAGPSSRVQAGAVCGAKRRAVTLPPQGAALGAVTGGAETADADHAGVSQQSAQACRSSAAIPGSEGGEWGEAGGRSGIQVLGP